MTPIVVVLSGFVGCQKVLVWWYVMSNLMTFRWATEEQLLNPIPWNIMKSFDEIMIGSWRRFYIPYHGGYRSSSMIYINHCIIFSEIHQPRSQQKVEVDAGYEKAMQVKKVGLGTPHFWWVFILTLFDTICFMFHVFLHWSSQNRIQPCRPSEPPRSLWSEVPRFTSSLVMRNTWKNTDSEFKAWLQNDFIFNSFNHIFWDNSTVPSHSFALSVPPYIWNQQIIPGHTREFLGWPGIFDKT